jgi:hypothetical protein
MRVLIRTNPIVQVLVTKTVASTCPLTAVVRNGRWLAEVSPGGVCTSFLEEARRLPTETRKNLARHLVGSDPETLAQIEALLH